MICLCIISGYSLRSDGGSVGWQAVLVNFTFRLSITLGRRREVFFLDIQFCTFCGIVRWMSVSFQIMGVALST